MAWEAREAIGIPPLRNYAGLRRNRSGFHYATLMTWLKGLLKTSGLGSVKKADTRPPAAPRSNVRLPTAGSCPLTCFVLKSLPPNLPSKPKLLGLENPAPTRNCIGSLGIGQVAKNPKFLLTHNGLGVGYDSSGIKWDAVVWRLAPVGASCSIWFHRPKRHATGP